MLSENTVTLLEIAGSDLSHARAAWASTNQELTEDNLDRVSTLLKFLAENRHETPFEHSLLSFRVQSDIATHIQFLKHRIGTSINSESARYKELKRDSYYIPEDWPDDIAARAEQVIRMTQKEYHSIIKELEEAGLSRARAKESARFLLPYANQIRFVVTFNFRSFISFLKLRFSDHAQQEICTIAQEMLRLVKIEDRFKDSLTAFGY
jgi:thymidylate synthase (FAD)